MLTKQFFKDLTLATLGASAFALVSLSPVFVYASEAPSLANKTAATQPVANPSHQLISSGSFEGRSKHITSGDVSIVKTATGYDLVLADNFFLDGAPAPVLGFGNGGKYDKSTTFAKLEKTEGGQTYSMPDGFTVSQYSQVFVWCEDFSVPLGVATLSK